MELQHFIFKPGEWIGEGKININESAATIQFYTRWLIDSEANQFRGIQTVEMVGGDEQIQNQLIFSNIEKERFSVSLRNELVQEIAGTGVIEKKKVAWEFRGHPYFEGFEVYELQENGDYLFHAEYVSQDHLRSIIEGRIWKKSHRKNP